MCVNEKEIYSVATKSDRISGVRQGQNLNGKRNPDMTVFVVVLIILCGLESLNLILVRLKLRSLNQQMSLCLREDATEIIHLKCASSLLEQVVDSVNSLLMNFRFHIQKERKKAQQNQQLLTTFSYDLQKPLIAVRDALEELDGANLKKEDRDILQKLWKSAVESAAMINNFVEYNYIMDVFPDIKICKFELTEIIENELEWNELKIQRKEIDYQKPKKEIFASGDCAIVGKMLHNLLANSLIHTTGPLKIFIQETEYVKMHFVSNLTQTQEAIDVTKVFDRYYTTDASKNKHKGLGLSLVRKLAEQIGGKTEARLYGEEIDIIIYLKRA